MTSGAEEVRDNGGAHEFRPCSEGLLLLVCVKMICLDSTSRQRSVVALPEPIFAAAVLPQVQIGRVSNKTIDSAQPLGTHAVKGVCIA